jgi:dihydropteroate synthase
VASVDGTLVMGVVNASPESFSDAGRCSSLQQRLDLGAEVIEAGAETVDIGG